MQIIWRDANRWVVCRAVFLIKDIWEKVFESWNSPRKLSHHASITHLSSSQLGVHSIRKRKKKKSSHVIQRLCFTFPILHSISTIKTHLNNYLLKFLCGLSNRSRHLAISNISCCFRAAKRLQSSLRYRPAEQSEFVWSP